MTGKFGFDHTEPPLYDAITRIMERAKAHDVIPGIHCGAASYAKRMIDLGFQFVTGGSDFHLMAAGARAAVLEAKGQGAAPAIRRIRPSRLVSIDAVNKKAPPAMMAGGALFIVSSIGEAVSALPVVGLLLGADS